MNFRGRKKKHTALDMDDRPRKKNTHRKKETTRMIRNGVNGGVEGEAFS